MSAIPVALQHLFAKMKPEVSAAVAGRVYFGVVPSATPTYPLVLIQNYGAGRDIRFNGQTSPIAMTNVEMQVQVVTEVKTNTNLQQIFDIYELIHGKLDGTTGTYPDGSVYDCSRYEVTNMNELDNGRTFMYYGGRYLLSVG